MFFIARGGRRYRREIYARQGIPSAKLNKIYGVREAQRIRLKEMFCKTRAGAKLYARSEKLGREHDILLSRLAKTTKRDKKLETKILAKNVKLLEATFEYVNALYFFVEKQEGVYKSTKKNLAGFVKETQLELIQAKLDQKPNKAGK